MGESEAASDPPPAARPSAEGARPQAASRLAVSLRGNLPCVQCGYELQGVSILGVCPECGTAVRATLLAVVDPLAAELQPIKRPRVVAAGLLLWVGAFCVAAVLCGAVLIRQLLVALQLGEPSPAPLWQAWTVCSLVLLAGLGAALIAHPHEQVNRRDTVMAWVAVGFHVPLAVAGVQLAVLHPTTLGPHGGGGSMSSLGVMWEPGPDRTLLRIASGVAGLAIIALMRPVTRVLVARSLAIRTGRVDRQTLLATAAAIVVVLAGDLLGLLARSLGSGAGEWVLVAAVTVVALGSLLLCLGLFGSLVDSVRIARAVIRPGPSIQQVLDGPPHVPKRAEGTREEEGGT
ncbi:MAG TPA: hypothetical protein VEB22_01340 [Phycisphaerales bacterium]|nr:hypothetical protein [Phycisphaerales bacterium]